MYLHTTLNLLVCLVLPIAVFALDLNAVAQRPIEEQLDSYSSKHLSDVIASSPLLTLHRALCEVESISNNENAVAKLLVSYLEAHNFSVTTQVVPHPQGSKIKKDRLNVIAFPQSSNDEKSNKIVPKVLLTSHIDTVPPFIPYTLSAPPSSSSSSASGALNRSAILISGRGTVDAKACVATQIHAVLSLLSNPNPIPATSLALAFVVGEEVAGDGMRHFSSSPLNTHANYSAVIFGEPTQLALASGHKGIVLATLRATGKAAHSGYPWLGRSATSLLVRALAMLDGLALPHSAKYGNTTLNIGTVRGGVAANVVPESAEAQVAVRIAEGSAEDIRGIVTKAVRGVEGAEFLEVGFSQGYGPVEIDADVPGFETVTVNYGTDIPNLSLGSGTKRYLFGPGSILVAHGEDEGLTVGDLETAVEGYKKLVLHALKV